MGFATLRRFQKEGSRAGVPIGCKTSAPSRGSKEMRNCQWRVSATFLPTFFPNDDDDDIFNAYAPLIYVPLDPGKEQI